MDEIPYGDEVSFYGNQKLKKLIYSKVRDKGRGWTEVQVGSVRKTTREKPIMEIKKILSEKYPEFQEVSLFNSLNYHAPIHNKTTQYGGQKYMLQHSKLKKLGVYELEQPVKSGKKRGFGKVVNKVPLYDWDYTAINWFGDNSNLELKRKIISPYGAEQIIYNSGQVPKSKSNKLIKQLKRMAGF